ncbi:hypothetical protein [Microseira wollei]|uniref:Lipoprotein n=1 Tax=Microseira wollei NIES-4236 TaxID=2530354 RepID=A0AAV3X2C3_9CYAN|nr:hypothetical protein [Microseira wollei]GET35316.1 hypothetical protein MiSe_00580 [Microseira wollei NIES-4236]
MATKHEALLKVEDNAAAKGIKAGETVTLIGSMGRADGKVVLNEVVSDKWKEGAGRYIHVTFVNKPSWQLQAGENLQTQAMQKINIVGGEWLS